MNRLWIWLSLLLGLGLAGSVGALSLLARQYVNQDFRNFLLISEVQEAGVDRDLAGFYAANGGWVGVARFLEGDRQAPAPGAPPGSPPVGPRKGVDLGRLRVTDIAGRQVYPPPGDPNAPPADPNGPPPARLPNPAPNEMPEVPLALEWNQQVVGTLWIRTRPADPLGRSAEAFLNQVNAALVEVGLLVGVVAVGLGILLARWLAAPLGRLETAAHRIAAGDLDERVPARGTVEMARLAQAFNTMAASLQQGEQLRRNMVGDIAHELRTPLTVLQGNLQALLDGVYPLSPAEIAVLSNETHILSRLVNDLYDLAQAEAGQLRLECRSLPLDAVAGQVVAVFAEAARLRDIRLTVAPGPALPPVWADPARVQQILTNLVSNAVRYTPDGGMVTVTLTLLPGTRHPATPPMVRLDVADSGPGLTPAEAARVFERFWRADAARARETGGAGLGLAIARQLVAAQGGGIGVDSAPGQGSRFWFTLPLAPATALAAAAPATVLW